MGSERDQLAEQRSIAEQATRLASQRADENAQLRALLREIHSAAKKGSLPFAIAVARKIDQSGLLGGSDG